MNGLMVVRQKANAEPLNDVKAEGVFPREDRNDHLHLITANGEIVRFSESTSEIIGNINDREIGSICYDIYNHMYLTDFSTKSLLFRPFNPEGAQLEEKEIAKEFEGIPFKGPNCLSYNENDNCIYFADCGKFEQGSLDPFDNVIYSIDLDTRVLKKILGGLSYVSDICYDKNTETLYVAETFMNRVIRMKQDEDGIFHTSVFYQFNGRIGPAALTVDEKGHLFVARMEYYFSEENEVNGLICTLDKEGTLLGELIVPRAPEIMGIHIPRKKKESLLLVQRKNPGVFKIKISAYSSEIDKYEYSLKSHAQ